MEAAVCWGGGVVMGFGSVGLETGNWEGQCC